jgi:CIC family chloride channel protein
MTACIPAIIVVRLLHGYSIYETKLLAQGIRIVRGHDVNRLRKMKVQDFFCHELETIRKHTPFHDLVQQVLKSGFPHFVVLDEHNRLAGVLTLRDIRSQLADPNYDGENVIAADLMHKEVVTVREDQNLEEAFHLFSSRNFSFLPVVAADDPRHVVGCLKKDDLITAYNQNVLREQVPTSARWICTLPDGAKRSCTTKTNKNTHKK